MYPSSNFWWDAGKMIIYPAWYASFAFALPFMINESVYGPWTNLNPNAWVFSSNGFVQNGNPLYIFVIPLLGLLFVFFMWAYRALTLRIVDNQYRFRNEIDA